MAVLVAEPGVAESIDVGKKKAPAKPEPLQDVIFVYKAHPAAAEDVKAWLSDLADDVGAPVTVTVDMALKEFAAKRGFRAMPKRLGGRR